MIVRASRSVVNADKLTRVLILKLGDVVDVLVDDDVDAVALAMRRDVVGSECFRHGSLCLDGEYERREIQIGYQEGNARAQKKVFAGERKEKRSSPGKMEHARYIGLWGGSE